MNILQFYILSPESDCEGRTQVAEHWADVMGLLCALHIELSYNTSQVQSRDRTLGWVEA